MAKKLCYPLFLSLITACGGPSQQAKVANAIQTLMANTIESFATKETTTDSVTLKCGDGSGDQGSFSYSVPADLSDPSALLDYVKQNGTVAGLDVTFNKCRVNACGDSVILDGGTAKLSLDISTLLEFQTSGDGQIPAAFQLSVTDQTASGIFSGTVSYNYIIEAIFTNSSVQSITLKDGNPVKPLSTGGTSYTGASLAPLADGC